MALETISEETRERFESQISKIFDQVQISASNHRKNHVALYKLHTELAAIKQPLDNGSKHKVIGESLFKKCFNGLLARTFMHKKGVTCADRVIKFVGSYIRFIVERDLEERDAEDTVEDDEDDEGTHITRFTAQLLTFLLEGTSAKDKIVRYRVLQTIAEMISHLGEIDQDQYEKLKANILDRTHDREASIRVQAVVSLAKLSDSDEIELDSDSPSIQDSLLQLMAHDSSADVRRCALLNMPINRQTLPAVLARMRDQDTSIRKSVYSLILEERVKPQADSQWREQAANYLHPQCLSIAQREQIIRSGLCDREPSVRAATESLISTWLELAGQKKRADSDEKVAEEDNTETSTTISKMGRMIALISLFYLQGEDIIAEKLLESLFNNPSVFRAIEFDGTYWEEITLEKAFLARVFVQHCRTHKKEDALENMLPVVMELAYRIQTAYNNVVQHFTDEAAFKLTSFDKEAASVGELEEKRDNVESILSELLKLTLELDYSDEIGRRKMSQLIRKMISYESLSESLALRCLDVLRKLASSEQDLVRIVVEEIQDLRDNALSEEDAADEENQDPDVSIDEGQHIDHTQNPLKKLSPEQQARADVVDLKCLALLAGMLERVNGKLRQNRTLEAALSNLILPAIQRKDMRFRQKGIRCMTLYCLISQELSLKFFTLLMQQVESSPMAIKVTIIQSVFDMLMMHESALFQGACKSEHFVKFILDLIQNEEDARLQAVLCEGLAKLMWANIIAPQEVLPHLIKAFISPSTKDNHELRQCLQYFFTRYSFSSKSYQQKMRQPFIHIFLDVCQDRHEADDEEADEIMSSQMLTDMFMRWTDPLQLEDAIRQAGQEPSNENIDYSIHMDIAHDVIKVLMDQGLKVTLAKEDKRVLCQALNRLHIPDTIDDLKIKRLKFLMNHLHQRSLGDAVSKNAFKKFEAVINKKFEKELENCTDEDLRKMEGLQDLAQYVDDIIPWSDDEEEPSIRAKKRRSQSTASMGTEGGVDEDENNSGGGRANKRARFANDQGSKRVLPRRAAKTNAKPIQVIDLEDFEEDVPNTLESAVSKLSVNESQLDRDISQLLDPLSAGTSTTVDSIIGLDADTEDEEDEVSELLAES